MPDYNQQLITLAQQAQYSQINALLNQMTPSDVDLITTSTISQVVGTLGFQFNDNAATANACVNSLRKFCEKMSAIMTASAIEFPLVNLVLGMEQANRGDWRAVDAVTDNLSTFEREHLSHQARNQIVGSMSFDIVEGLQSNNTTIIEGTTAALRNFMSKFGASTQIGSIDFFLVSLAQGIEVSNTGDYRAIDAITDYLLPYEREQLQQFIRSQVVGSISFDITQGLQSNNTVVVEGATAALRNFMSKFGASTQAMSIEMQLTSLAQGIEFSNTGDYRAIDAITDYLTAFEREQLSHPARNQIVGSMSFDITQGLQSNDTVVVEGATAALRNFMSKFGASTQIGSIDFFLVSLAQGIEASNTGDYRAIDAITDYLIPSEREQLQQFIRSQVVGSISFDITQGLQSNNTVVVEGATAALRNFMSKFGASTQIMSVEFTLISLAQGIEASNTGDYRAIDAITDYLTAFERGQLSDPARGQVTGAISFDITEGLNFGNEALADNATAALHDFMSKFGATTSINAVEMVIQNLAFANATDGLNAFFTYLPDSTLNNMSPMLKSMLNDVENIYWGNASSSNVTYGTTNDTVYGLGGNDTLHGDGGNDIIYGGKGNDVLYGDADNDILIGENGSDTLYGGTGADTFVLALQGSNFDTVKDFSTAETDKLDLSNILTSFDPLTQNILDYVSATSAGGNTTLLVDADGAGAGIARAVAVLEGVASFDVLDNYNNGTIIV